MSTLVPSVVLRPSVTASASPVEPEVTAPVNADADNRPSVSSRPATPAAQLAWTGSVVNASLARPFELAIFICPAFSTDVPTPTPSAEGMRATSRTASPPCIGLSDLRPGAPADIPVPASAGITPQPERAPPVQPASATTSAWDYRPTPTASPSAPSP